MRVAVGEAEREHEQRARGQLRGREHTMSAPKSIDATRLSLCARAAPSRRSSVGEASKCGPWPRAASIDRTPSAGSVKTPMPSNAATSVAALPPGVTFSIAARRATGIFEESYVVS